MGALTKKKRDWENWPEFDGARLVHNKPPPPAKYKVFRLPQNINDEFIFWVYSPLIGVTIQNSSYQNINREEG